MKTETPTVEQGLRERADDWLKNGYFLDAELLVRAADLIEALKAHSERQGVALGDLGRQAKTNLDDVEGKLAQMTDKLERIMRLAEEVSRLANHGIPAYAYSDNEAAVEMSHRLEQIANIVGEQQ